jgi:hypothetical protein
LLSFKKGTRSFRNILNRVGTKKVKNGKQLEKMKISFEKSIGVENTNLELFSIVQGSWAENLFPATTRTFLFKLYNNLIGTNSRVAHFNKNVDASCTFCTKSLLMPSPKETVRHLLYDCPQVFPVIESFYELTFNNIIPTPENFFGGGGFGISIDDDIFGTQIVDTLKFHFWECKINKKIPDFNTNKNLT